MIRAARTSWRLSQSRRRRMQAREVSGEEREELWRRAVDFYSGYEVYRQRADGRVFPLLRLSDTH